MTQPALSVAQKQDQKTARKLKYPRRTLDKQGRGVQFPQWKGFRVWRIVSLIFAPLLFLIAVVLFNDGETVGGISTLFGGLAYLGIFWMFLGTPTAWYYEDDYGFEVLTQFFHRRVSIPYSDISSWRFERKYILRIKTFSGKSVPIFLMYIRPLKLLNALVTMEIEGRFKRASAEKHAYAIWEIDSEFCMHANKALEEMRVKGIHVDIPER